MNPLIKKALIAIVVLAFAALMIKTFQSNFEYVEETEWRPFTGEAKTNPLYASKLFLRRMGIPTETVDSVQDLTTLPDTDTVILISSSRENLRGAQVSNLLAWVKNGGHLIITGLADWNSFASDEPLVDESQNDPDEPVYYEEFDQEFISESSGDALQEFLGVDIREGIQFEDEKPETISIKGSSRGLQLGPDYYRAIVVKDGGNKGNLEQIDIDGKNVIIRQQVDRGLITLVSDLEFIDNFNLKDFDHAEILWQLIRGKAAAFNQKDLLLPEAVWLIHSDETANLFELIWKYFWALVITLIIFFAFWMMRVSRRFGPVITKEEDDRRNLMEHIDASGVYYWKQHDHSGLLESTRNAAQQMLAKRIPGWHAMEQPDQVKLLSKRLSISEPQLSKTLYGSIGKGPHEFTETIKQLEHIRTSL